MNKSNAKRLSQKEIYNVIPAWWIDIYKNSLSIIKHSKFNNFHKVETFLKATLSHIVVKKEESSIKHIKVKCANKGIKDKKIYITLEIFFKMKNESFWKLSKSLHVNERNYLNRD